MDKMNKNGSMILEASVWSAIVFLIILLFTKNYLYSYRNFQNEIQKEHLPLRQ